MICIVLAASSLHGVYMRHDQVQELMDAMNKPKIAHTLREAQHNGSHCHPLGGVLRHQSRVLAQSPERLRSGRGTAPDDSLARDATGGELVEGR